MSPVLPVLAIVALSLAACAGAPREPVPPTMADECRVEPQPLSCAGAADAEGRAGAR